MNLDNRQLLEFAIHDQKYIEDLRAKLYNPFLDQEQARAICRQLSLANIANIQEANRRGLL